MREDTARELADATLDYAESLGASYADVRMYLGTKSESLTVKNDVVESIDTNSDSGAGVRILKNGAWGFASFSDLSRRKDVCRRWLLRMVREAVVLAETSARLRTSPIELVPLENVPRTARYEIPYAIDPFNIPVGEKVILLKDFCAALQGESNKIMVRSAALDSEEFTKFFASSERAISCRRYLTQTLHTCGLVLSALAIDGNEVQERFYGAASAGGFEFINQSFNRMLAERLAQEVLELLSAKECEPGVLDIIIMPDHLGLHVHETGHGFEGDRLLGYEQTYIGGTFINEIVEEIGYWQFGSEAVNIIADATFPGGYGTFGFDDEGVPAQCFSLVERGTIKNVLTSRETVPQINRRIGRDYFKTSNGSMRAYSYTRMPLIRMTNVSLLPGEGALKDIISRVDRGLLLSGTQSWSMSEDRKNFDFGIQYARRIRNGVLGPVVRNAGYTGNNLAFWKSCEAVAGEQESWMYNVPNCGKGMPGQSMKTGHHTSPALFRGVEIYNRKQRKVG